MAKTKVHGEFLKDSVVRFTAKAGENITKGQAVYISGISGEVPVVSLADADDTAKMPAFGLAEATVSTNAEVEITSFGTLKGLDTSSYSLGDILYVDTTAGSLTNNPSGLEATKLQNIGIVQRVHATSGSIKVGGAGRTNAVPNLDDGDIFIGDSNNKAVSDSFTNVLNTEAGINSSANATAITIDSSENVGIGGSPSNKLEIQHGTIGTGNGSNNTLALRYNSTTLYGQHYMDGNGLYHIRADAQGVAGGNLILGGDNSVQIWTGSTPEDRVVVDSSGSLLVNSTSAGSSRLKVVGDASRYGILSENLSGYGAFSLKSTTVAQTWSIGAVDDGSNSDLFIYGGSSAGTKVTLDSSGRLLVGATSPFSADSVTIDQGGFLAIRNTSGSGMEVRRDSTDGSLIDFQKDGSPVGSIGTQGSSTYIAGASSGLRFAATNIMPVNSSGTFTDNTSDLGGSTERFKDLYLSGKAKTAGADLTGQVQHFAGNVSTYFNAGNSRYGQIFMDGGGFNIKGWTGSGEPILYNAAATGASHRFQVAGAEKVRITNDGITFNGDTAAANALDDYEEGTWTPNLQRVDGSIPATFTTHSGSATYTKIGNMVNVNAFIKSISVGSSNGSNYWVLYNIPFAAQVIDYTGGILAYNSTGADSVYVGDASGNAILTSGNNPYTGSISGGFMFNITFRVS